MLMVGKVWMLMSDSCRKSKGFTLLELMVVLGLVTVVSAVVFPGLLRLYESVSGAIELEEIVMEINGLGRKSFESGQGFRLNGRNLPLPEGWRLEVHKPVVYTASGVCRGGTVSIIRDNELQLSQRLSPPYCQINHES